MEDYGLLTASATLSGLVSLGLHATLIVIAVSNVRPVDKSASGLFVASGIVAIVSMIGGFLLNLLPTQMGTGDMPTFFALSSLLRTILWATAYALLLGGIVRLAKSMKRDPREPTPF